MKAKYGKKNGKNKNEKTTKTNKLHYTRLRKKVK